MAGTQGGRVRGYDRTMGPGPWGPFYDCSLDFILRTIVVFSQGHSGCCVGWRGHRGSRESSWKAVVVAKRESGSLEQTGSGGDGGKRADSRTFGR